MSEMADNEPCPKVNDHGITVLYTPNSGECEADLLFVHGLGGHPLKTWLHGKIANSAPSRKPRQGLRNFVSSLRRKSRSASPADVTRPTSSSPSTLQTNNPTTDHNSSYCYWPFDLVKDAFQTVRIMTYGYDSNPSHFYRGRSVQMNISQHADQLRQAVSDQRVECRGRPIIFVAYSLGGILVKDALIQAAKYEQQPDLLDLSKSCSAIIFFGTPHRGANAAAYGEIVANLVDSLPFAPSVYKEVLHGLRPDGEKISNVEKDFNDFINKNIPASEKIQIYSFQEGRGLTSLNTLDQKVVPDSSSHFNRRDIEQTSFVMATHMDMCRFTTEGQPGFPAFRAALSGYLNRIRQRQNAEQTRAASAQTALSEVLDFDEMYQRQHDLAGLQTFDETFSWVWHSVFADWLKTLEPLFWIRGKPASGKSTLINHLTKAPETREIAQESLGANFQLVHHFFDFRAGDRIANSFRGFLLSLLSQLVGSLPHESPVISKLDKHLQKNRDQRGKVGNISLEVLRSSLSEILRNTHCGILILLDGLDEYVGNRVELVLFIESLHGPNVKICLASRSDPPFPDAFKSIPCLEMHEVNRPGISAYAIFSLQEIISDCEGYSKAELEETADIIVQEAEGVFLWARFAILELISAISEGRSVDARYLQATVGKMPKELGDIYSHIFQRLTEGDRKICAVVLLLTISAMDNILLTMMQMTMTKLLPESLGFGILELPTTADQIIRFEKRIISATRGLVELRPFDRANSVFLESVGVAISNKLIVRLLHRTVATYLDDTEWSELLGDKLYAGIGDEIWLRVSVAAVNTQRGYLLEIMNKDGFKRYSLNHPQWEDGKQLSAAGHNLLSYAITHMPQHAFNFESRSAISSFSILNGTIFDQIARIHSSMCDHMCQCQQGSLSRFQWPARRAGGSVTDTLRVATGHSLHLFVRDFLAHGQDRRIEELEVTGNTTCITTGSTKAFDATLHMSFDNTMTMSMTDFRLIKDIILQYAVDFAQIKSESMSLVMIQAALGAGDTLPDFVVFEALRGSSIEVIELLLQQREPDRSLLLKQNPNRSPQYAQHACLLSCKDEKREYGLFWPLGQRKFHPSNTEMLIDLLIARGEKINATCGPFGTVLHSLVDNVRYCSADFDSQLHLFIRKGANINARGCYGNVLEFGWKITNELISLKSTKRKRYADMIKSLIAAGAVNSREDPNGMIPSEEHMLCWVNQWGNG